MTKTQIVQQAIEIEEIMDEVFYDEVIEENPMLEQCHTCPFAKYEDGKYNCTKKNYGVNKSCSDYPLVRNTFKRILKDLGINEKEYESEIFNFNWMLQETEIWKDMDKLEDFIYKVIEAKMNEEVVKTNF